MGLRFENLDAETRRLMVEEIDSDTAAGRIYISNYLNADGAAQWPRLLRDAAGAGTDETLARELRTRRHFKVQVERRKPKGGYTMVNVPTTAPETLSESQFNMYYMRALARRALAHGGQVLVVYRAKEVEHPRPESERMIGDTLDPNVVLTELRKTQGVDPSIGIPLPNSGLCVRLSQA